MRLHTLLPAASVCVLLPLLAACSRPAPASHAGATPPAPAGSAARVDHALANTPLAPLLQDEQRARNVQNIVNRQAAQQRAQIDSASH
jgi:hypothetical protein